MSLSQTKLKGKLTPRVLWLISSDVLRRKNDSNQMFSGTLEAARWGREGAEVDTHIFPRGITTFSSVNGSTFTTHKGVPTLNVPSKMYTLIVIGSLFADTSMIFSLHGQTACGSASLLLACVIPALYVEKASNRREMRSA